MSEYNILTDNINYNNLQTNDILNCPFSGSVQTITLPPGEYQLECWGAQGGSWHNPTAQETYFGGLGGYSKGTLKLTYETPLYLYVGGMPTFEIDNPPAGTKTKGFNGGGQGTVHVCSGTSSYALGGGGGTDIRIGTDSLYARVIVAGGGAGSSSNDMRQIGAAGGEISFGGTSSYDANQTSAGSGGSFGVGGPGDSSNTNYKYAAGGGGGGWYGGGASTAEHDTDTTFREHSGGGTGYIYTKETALNYYNSSSSSHCLLNSSHYLTNTVLADGKQTFKNPVARKNSIEEAEEIGHSEDGFIRITVLNKNQKKLYIKKDPFNWKEVSQILYKTEQGWK